MGKFFWSRVNANMLKPLATVCLILITAVAGQPRTTTTSSPVPEPDAELQEVWDWLASLQPSDTEEAAINVNMYMAYNQMSMTGTKFSMNVGDEQAGDEERADRMPDGGDEETTKTWSWSWTPSPIGGTVNMYMYKNAMSMEDTVFTMNVADDGSFSGSASANFESTRPGERSFGRMRSGKGSQHGEGLSVNMFMFNNSMAMKETIFTMDVDSDD